MKRLPNNAVHKALVAFLRNHTGLAVYDYVPQEAVLPFITLGTMTVQDKSTKTDDMTHLVYGNSHRKFCSHACYIAYRFGGVRHG